MPSPLDPPMLVTFVGSMNWTVGFLTTVAIFGILALALNLQWGYSGVFNFGIVAFFMAGAYTSALLTIDAPSDFENYIGGFELPVLVGWLGGAAAGGLLALVVGLPTLRLRRDFLAIATIGIAAILRSTANSVEGFVNRGRGLNGIPRFLDGIVDSSEYRWVLLAITGTMLVLVYLVLSRVTASPWGRTLRAIRENEDTAKSTGKDTVSFRMQSFVLGGMIMGLAGAIWAHRIGTIAPDSFKDIFGTFLVWTMLIVGGSGNNRGAVLGAVLVGFFWFGTPLIQEDLPDALGTRVFMLRQFAIGLLVVIFVLLRPQGLLPEQARVSRYMPRGPTVAGPG
ncbi:MAG TPA: branched-chain amino acid ABC transporter permease [Dehalococcoidia bacterium]|jgi:branched-chain amino acid transport system permease protein|nr:branched-chain amino acid ABC transporter permease [Dehalococcoidia bacterium]